MRTSRRIAAVLAALAFAVACNAVLSFVLVPYGSKSQVVWTDYRAQEHLDTVFVGNSLAQRACDPAVFDGETGAQSFNMASPNQSLEESFVAVQTAYRDFGIKRAVVGVPHSSMLRSSPPNPGSAFVWERARVVPVLDTAKTMAWMLFQKGAWTETDSLNIPFPWTSNHVKAQPKLVASNVRMRLQGADVHTAAEAAERGWMYQGKGYGNYKTVLDYNGSKAIPYFSQNADDVQSQAADRAAEPDPQRADTLVQMCRWCAERDIELVAVAPPIPAFNILDYGPDYFALQDRIAALVQDNGGTYYDFNMARPDVLSLDEDMFADSEHLNIEGAVVFTKALVRVLEHDAAQAEPARQAGTAQAGQAGQDAQWERGELFLDAGEWAASIDYISTVFVDTSSDKDAVRITARAMCGPNVDVEYRVRQKVDGEWQVVRDWGSDPLFAWTPEEHGSHTVRVEARQAGEKKVERRRTLTVVW